MENIYAQWVIAKMPHENAPDFVRWSLSIKVDEFITFLQDNRDWEWINLQLLTQKKDSTKMSVKLDTWKPNK